ncbi:hypothetical protein Btru_058801 [Bulinus truncatus]|nr:hypothetical protein Btru_058801 [Bulinus truncatus]
MTSRTGLFPAVTNTKTIDRPTYTMLKSTNSKKNKENVATYVSVSSSTKGPHATCEACSAKKSMARNYSPSTNMKTTFLKRKSDLGFLTGEKQHKFAVVKKSRSNENLVSHDIIPRSILKKDELRAQETRHVQFNSQVSDQASLRAKLNNWLKEKGKTPGSCRHLLKFGANLSAVKKRSLTDVTSRQNLKENSKLKDPSKFRKNLFGDDEADSCENYANTIEGVDEKDEQNKTTENAVKETGTNMAEHLKSMLDECLTLFHDGCSMEIVLPWLEKMETSIPDVITFAPYYVCKAKVLGAFPQMVLDVYTQAVRNNAQPSDLLADEMKAALSHWLLPRLKSPDSVTTAAKPLYVTSTECTSPLPMNLTPEKSQLKSFLGTKEGSTVKYKITTPSLRGTSESNMAVVTPVRRSARLSSKHPTPCRQSDVVNRIVEISPTDRRSMVFKINPLVAGKDDVSDPLNRKSFES